MAGRRSPWCRTLGRWTPRRQSSGTPSPGPGSRKAGPAACPQASLSRMRIPSSLACSGRRGRGGRRRWRRGGGGRRRCSPSRRPSRRRPCRRPPASSARTPGT
uniref:Acco20 n=1 Tax=Arundo donax TaxID=35708 RepID=A0A0A9CJ44_ARUDO